MVDKLLIKTNNLNLASALLSLGHSILGVDSRKKGKIFFYFEKTQITDDIIAKYWDKELRVCPRSLAESRKEILVRINESQGFKEYYEDEPDNQV